MELDVLVEVEVVELVVEDVEVVVEVVEDVVLEDDEEELEVDVQVRSEFPNKNSDISTVLRYDDSISTSMGPAIKDYVVLYGKDPEFTAANSRAIFDSGRVVKREIQFILAFIIDFHQMAPSHGRSWQSSPGTGSYI